MHPPIRIRILASGSQGNCAVVSLQPCGESPTHLLIDLGLSPRKLLGALAVDNLHPDDITAILLTHADSDHVHGGWSQRWPFSNARIIARQGHHRAIAQAGIPVRSTLEADGDARAYYPNIRSHALPHDMAGSTGFRISCDGASLGWATDVGRMSSEAVAFFTGVDALCIESNYDPQLQMRSSRPDFLKRRIMGGNGHLSNTEALRAALQVHGSRALSHIVLLHLSAQCNSHELVRGLWSALAPDLDCELHVAMQEAPLPWIGVGQAIHRTPAIATLQGLP